MRRLLSIALSALMLSGCMAEWKNPKGPERYGVNHLGVDQATASAA